MVRLSRALAAGLASVMLLVACGDDEDSSSATTVAPTTSTTLSQVDLDKAKAQRIVLTAADVPGYTTDPPEPDEPDDPEEEAALNACVDNDPLFVQLGKDGNPRGATSPDFSKGETVTVSSEVTFADSEDQARATITAVGAAKFATCFSNGLARVLRKDGTFTNVSATTTKLPAMAVGDQSVGYRTVARVRAGGTSLTLYFDIVLIRSGRALTGLTLFSATTPFPEAERLRLSTVIAGRMAAP